MLSEIRCDEEACSENLLFIIYERESKHFHDFEVMGRPKSGFYSVCFPIKMFSVQKNKKGRKNKEKRTRFKITSLLSPNETIILP